MIREIHIKPVLNGYVVQVGCQTLAFGDPTGTDRPLKDLLSSLEEYLRRPDVIEPQWAKSSLNSKHTLSPPACEPADPSPNRLERTAVPAASQAGAASQACGSVDRNPAPRY